MKAPFSNSYYTEMLGRVLHFILDPYLIMPSVKQGGIKYYF